MRVNHKDIGAALFFVAVGTVYGLVAWSSLRIGSTFDMGPGYFPIMLSLMLIALGFVIGARAFVSVAQQPFGSIPWRGIVFLSLAVATFAAFLDDLGLFPGVFATTFLAVLASPGPGLVRAVATSLAIAVLCTVVFSYGIGLTMPVIGPVFTD